MTSSDAETDSKPIIIIIIIIVMPKVEGFLLEGGGESRGPRP